MMAKYLIGNLQMATTLDGYVNNPRCAPASSPSTSNQSVASYIHSVLDNPEIADAFTKKQEELKQAQSQSPVQEKSIGVLSDIRVQQQPQSQSVPLSDEVLSTVPQSTSEQVRDIHHKVIMGALLQQQCASLASPPHSIPQQPTMGTCAANEVRFGLICRYSFFKLIFADYELNAFECFPSIGYNGIV